jgi:hypothetical protein
MLDFLKELEQRHGHLTLSDIETIPCDWLTPQAIGYYEKSNPYYLNCRAKNGNLPYAFRFSGNRLKIYKQSYVDYWRNGERKDVC